MSAPSGAANNGVPSRDLEILAYAWKTSQVAPQVDYAALADGAFYKNAESARVAFRGLKKRVFGEDYKDAVAPAGDVSGSPKKKPTTPRKRKGKAEPAAEDGEAVKDKDEDQGQSPKKKGKKVVAKKATVEDEEEVKGE